MFKHSKSNFKELGKDAKAFACSAFGIVKGVVKIPVAFCKDVRDSYLDAKAKAKETVEVIPNEQTS